MLPVKVDPTLWESISKSAKFRDLKVTDIQKNLSKAGTIVAKVVQALALSEETPQRDEGKLILMD